MMLLIFFHRADLRHRAHDIGLATLATRTCDTCDKDLRHLRQQGLATPATAALLISSSTCIASHSEIAYPFGRDSIPGSSRTKLAVTVMVTRAEYLARSLSRQQPWLGEGISRRTWERRRRKINAVASTQTDRPPGVTRAEAKGVYRPLTAGGASTASKRPRAEVGPADKDTSPLPLGKTVRRREEDLLMRQIHDYWDVRGMTHSDPQALPKAIHAIKLPERFELMDTRALGKVYRRARERLPLQYDRWISLVERWDKSYNRHQARKLVDGLVTGLGNRPSSILSKLFDHLEQQYCDNWKRKVKRLEAVCERLEREEWYMPTMPDLKKDDLRDQVYAALADGPKTKKQLARRFGRTCNAILAVGQHLRDAGLIETVSVGGRFMWARVGTAPSFVVARDAIVTTLKEGPMSVPELAKKTGKSEVTITNTLQSYLLPNNEVMRTKRGIYALPGTEPSYISKSEAIVAALKKGPMSISALCQTTSTALDAIYQFIRPLLANRKVIRTKRGVYALPGAAPVFVTTDDVIIRALRKRPMRLPALAQHINKPPTTVLSALARLKTAGTVKHDGWGAEYRLARRVPRTRSTQQARRNPAAGLSCS
jgi:predicted transcriptional regulator